MLSGSVVYYCIYLRSKQDEEATLTSGFYFEGKVVKECSVVGSEGEPLDGAGMLDLFPERRWRKLGGC